jgi:hypothetical protein
MPRIALPGGTDVAEMALFSIDALSGEGCPDPATLASMEAQNFVMRFPTGSDGGYLLHVYLDEAIPEEVMRYCVLDDALKGRLKIEHGRLGFGGSESLYANFESNSSIRTDARVPPGEYDVIAYHTEYPDELIEAAVKAKIGEKASKFLALPGYVIAVTVLFAAIAIVTQAWYLAVSIAGAAFFGLRFLFFNNDRIKLLQEQKQSVELSYPSIVVQMLSRSSWRQKATRTFRT